MAIILSAGLEPPYFLEDDLDCVKLTKDDIIDSFTTLTSLQGDPLFQLTFDEKAENVLLFLNGARNYLARQSQNSQVVTSQENACVSAENKTP